MKNKRNAEQGGRMKSQVNYWTIMHASDENGACWLRNQICIYEMTTVAEQKF